jgi:hypothetical protein
LTAYEVSGTGPARHIAAGKLSYRLRKEVGGHWVWSERRIITDSTAEENRISQVLQDLWTTQPDVFADVRGVRLDGSWKPRPKNVADFVAFGLVSDLESELRHRLPPTIELGPVLAERSFEIHGWEVANRPAISISIFSRLVHSQNLQRYLATCSNVEELIGLEVFDRSSSFKGEVEAIVGPLRDHRARLLSLAQRPESQQLLAKAPDEEPILRIGNGRSGYDYALSALGIVVRVRDFARFRVDARRALSVLKIAPADRWRMVSSLAQLLHDRKLVEPPLRSDRPGGEALARTDGLRQVNLRFGNGQVRPAESPLLRNLAQCGLFRISPRFANEPIRVGVLDSVKSLRVRPFLEDVTRQVQGLHLRCTFEDLAVPRDLSRVALESAADRYESRGLDLLLALFPDFAEEDGDGESEEWGPYRILKSLTVGRGIPSQVVMEETMANPYALGNVVLGILGKTGNVPFTLAERMPGIDLVVGLDIARARKSRLPGSVNATAITRIYFSDGEFLRYAIHDAPLEGETIPDDVLQGLFPRRDFAGKRVIVHRDGFFRGGEREALERWGNAIGATFHLVEVIKTGSPRIYGMNGGDATLPEKGMLLKASDTEAFVVSSLPPFRDATPNPLHVRTDGTLALKSAIDSILLLTLLHHGSVRPPRLPVTLHYSDKIAYLALRGIKPKELEGSSPYWL